MSRVHILADRTTTMCGMIGRPFRRGLLSDNGRLYLISSKDRSLKTCHKCMGTYQPKGGAPYGNQNRKGK